MLAPGEAIGSYRVLTPVGSGGMATVYKAYQPGLDRHVAIKLLPENLAANPDSLERFRREATAVAGLRHPNIPSVHDNGEHRGQPYIVTEFVDGGTLDGRLGQPLPAAEVVAILGPLAAALDYAHGRGVVHRDVKPSNVIVAGDGTPILTDFGLARMMESGEGLTASGTVLGTPEYMAPEQCAGEPAGPAADQYSLAVIAYQMLTGRVPFQAATPAAVLIAQIQSPLPLPRVVNPTLSEAVERALLRGLAKAPADRFPTCADLVAAIQASVGSPTAPTMVSKPVAVTGRVVARDRTPIGILRRLVPDEKIRKGFVIPVLTILGIALALGVSGVYWPITALAIWLLALYYVVQKLRRLISHPPAEAAAQREEWTEVISLSGLLVLFPAAFVMAGWPATTRYVLALVLWPVIFVELGTMFFFLRGATPLQRSTGRWAAWASVVAGLLVAGAVIILSSGRP